MACEYRAEKDEPFLDLSVEVDQDVSLAHCINRYSVSEMLSHANKFYCDNCCCLQEAEKRFVLSIIMRLITFAHSLMGCPASTRIKQLPTILAIHLKRFKYREDLGRHFKLMDRVVFQEQLCLTGTVSSICIEFDQSQHGPQTLWNETGT